MNTLNDYPGTPQHQALLHAIVSHYESDPRILAITIFGSLGRGNWDRYSDLDLDVVIADGVGIDINAELKQLLAAVLNACLADDVRAAGGLAALAHESTVPGAFILPPVPDIARPLLGLLPA